MMRFFSKIRISLFGDKALQYLQYALGEIILVVIGILIAVAINNRNERQKIVVANKDLTKSVVAQLTNDITEIRAYQQYLDTLEQGYRKVLNRPYDTSKLAKDFNVGRLLFEIRTITPDVRVVNLIDNTVLGEDSNTQKLINLSSTYKAYHDDLKNIATIIFEASNNNLKAIETAQQDWYISFITDFICSEECYDYLANDKSFKERMASLRFLYVNGYGGVIEELRKTLEEYRDDLK